MTSKFKSSKQNQSDISVKDLMSKLYFSRTQQNYLKIYGGDNHYKQELIAMMNRSCKKKLNKIIEQVKQTNQIFRKYLQKKRIVKLTSQDVNNFFSKIQNDEKKTMGNIMNNLSIRCDSSHKNLDTNIIKIGFMMILSKLNDEISQNFINQAKYIKQMIIRQNQNLNRLGYDYLGVSHQIKDCNFLKQFQEEQREVGGFKLITKKLRDQTKVIQEVSQELTKIILPR